MIWFVIAVILALLIVKDEPRSHGWQPRPGKPKPPPTGGSAVKHPPCRCEDDLDTIHIPGD